MQLVQKEMQATNAAQWGHSETQPVASNKRQTQWQSERRGKVTLMLHQHSVQCDAKGLVAMPPQFPNS